MANSINKEQFRTATIRKEEAKLYKIYNHNHPRKKMEESVLIKILTYAGFPIYIMAWVTNLFATTQGFISAALGISGAVWALFRGLKEMENWKSTRTERKNREKIIKRADKEYDKTHPD